jgi:hypothetical protein
MPSDKDIYFLTQVNFSQLLAVVLLANGRPLCLWLTAGRPTELVHLKPYIYIYIYIYIVFIFTAGVPLAKGRSRTSLTHTHAGPARLSLALARRCHRTRRPRKPYIYVYVHRFFVLWVNLAQLY